MDMPYRLLVADTANSALLLINGPDGEILLEWPLPPEFTPLDICLVPGANCAYIPAVNDQARGALFVLALDSGLSQLPLALPAIERFAVGPRSGQAMLTTRDGSLFLLDISQHKLTLFGSSQSTTACVGLAADCEAVYTVWQQEAKGVLAVFSPDGQLQCEQELACLPTNLSQSEHYLYIPFTAAGQGDEGVLLIKKQELTLPTLISLHHCPTESTFRTYPCYVAATPDETLAYVIHEDSANISIIDIPSATVNGYIPVGRSLSFMVLLPEAKFAVAGSFMFADLSLIDLVNRRLLSMTDNADREVLGQIAILPAT